MRAAQPAMAHWTTVGAGCTSPDLTRAVSVRPQVLTCTIVSRPVASDVSCSSKDRDRRPPARLRETFVWLGRTSLAWTRLSIPRMHALALGCCPAPDGRATGWLHSHPVG